MDEHQRITSEFLTHILCGEELRPSVPLEYLAYALKLSKNEAEKELAKEIYQKATELQLLDASIEITSNTRRHNIARREEIMNWLAAELRKLKKEKIPPKSVRHTRPGV